MAIATLIAAGRLDDRLIADALDCVPGATFERWIDEGDAAELRCEGEPKALRFAFEAMDGLDVAVRRGPQPDYGLFVADMDSTIIGQECIDELADYAGFKSEVAAITERAMAGELDFADALAQRVALLEGLDTAVLTQCLTSRVRPNPGAATLIATLKARGIRTILVSGGFVDFVAPVARQLGFDQYRANQLGSAGGHLSGRTEGEIVDSVVKRRVAEEALRDLDALPEALAAIGDGANDIPMVELAGLGIGYRPKAALDAVADAAIRHHDLTAALWMLGIPRREWVRGPTQGSTPAL